MSEAALQAGFARVDITPKESVPLGGMGNGHARMPSYVHDPLYTTCIAFTWSPYEMFCDNGVFVKEHSPFPATFVLTCANGRNNYIVSKAAFDYGCYERDNRNFIRGTAEMLADNFVEILKELR